jgi:thiamine-phosphate pyrophosphorylase
MKLVVISPPEDRVHERRVCLALFQAGLARYHLRKPHWSEAATSAWVEALPRQWRSRVVLHAHHGLRAPLGAGGVHFRDDGTAPTDPGTHGFASRACHSAEAVAGALGRYHAVLVGPVFASHSKPGYGPLPWEERDKLRALLAARTPTQQGTEVLAIGGIDARSLPRCRAMGFDGAAVLGALWDAPDPVATFLDLQATADSTVHPTESSSSP